jgi:hypothetical protein
MIIELAPAGAVDDRVVVETTGRGIAQLWKVMIFYPPPSILSWSIGRRY